MGRPRTYFDGKTYNQRAAEKLDLLGGKRFGMNMSPIAVIELQELTNFMPEQTKTDIIECAISRLLTDMKSDTARAA